MNSKENKKMLTETIFVIIITVILFFLFPNLKSIIPVIPAVYFIVERRIRKRTWSEIGFKLKGTFTDIKDNLYLIILVGVIIPIVTILISKYFLPDFISHLTGRLPMDVKSVIPSIITILIGTFLEEIIFRGFIQGRLSIFIKSYYAIITASILFAFMHYSSGNLSVVSFDILGIFIDSIIYGIIFNRTRNIFASWTGHLLSDVIGLIGIYMFL